MRKFLAVLFVAAFCFSISGCSLFTSADETFVRGVDGYAQVILPEYEKYIDADPTLKPETKKLRKESSQKFMALIEEGKKK